MGWGVYKQPDGLYAVWSTIVDDFVFYDCTAEDIANVWKEQFGESGMHSLERVMAHAEGTRPHPLGYTFEDRFVTREVRHRRPEGEEDDDPDVEYEKWLAQWRTPLVNALVHEHLVELEADS